MSLLVLDCSMTMTWVFEDEATAETDSLFRQIAEDAALVPALWHLEVASVFLQAEKRGRLSAADLAGRLDLIAQLPILVDSATATRAWRDTLSVARQQRLTSYDAAYLELALRRSATLLTLDRDLGSAAARLGLPVLPQQ